MENLRIYDLEKIRNVHLVKILNGEVYGPLTGYPSKDKPWLKHVSEEKISKALPRMSAYQYVVMRNFETRDNIAMEYFGRKITYGEFFEGVEKCAKAFKELGVRKGDIVTISAVLTPEVMCSFYALNKLGAISNMVDPRTNQNGMREYLNEVDSKFMIMINPCYPNVEPILKDTSVSKVITLDPTNSAAHPLKDVAKVKSYIESSIGKSPKIDYSTGRFVTWNDFMRLSKNCKENIVSEYKSDNPVCIVHTGGTTGFPKGVVLTDDNLNSMIHQIDMANINFHSGQKFLNVLVPFVAYGVANGIHLALCKGWDSVMVPVLDQEKLPKLILKNLPDNVLGVPTYFEKYMTDPKVKKADLSFHKNIIVGGDSAKVEFEKDFNEFLNAHNANISLIKGYGMTESSACASFCNDTDNKLGSVGVPLCDTIISAFDVETGKELPYNTPGEICITGPAVMLEYFNNKAETDHIMRLHDDGKKWIHSGDIGYVDEDGLVYITDRIKRIIIRSGYKVSPSLLENVLMRCRKVDNCCVVGIPDPFDVTAPKAHIVLKKEYVGYEEEVKDELIKLCEDNLQPYMMPVEFKFRDSLPKTSIGKIDFMSLIKEEDEDVKKKVLK